MLLGHPHAFEDGSLCIRQSRVFAPNAFFSGSTFPPSQLLHSPHQNDGTRSQRKLVPSLLTVSAKSSIRIPDLICT
jgi:hypothetical protein